MHSASMQVEHSSKMSLSAIDNSRNKGDSFKFFSLTEDSSISKNPLLPTRVSDPSVFQFHLISDDGSSQNTSDQHDGRYSDVNTLDKDLFQHIRLDQYPSLKTNSGSKVFKAADYSFKVLRKDIASKYKSEQADKEQDDLYMKYLADIHTFQQIMHHICLSKKPQLKSPLSDYGRILILLLLNLSKLELSNQVLSSQNLKDPKAFLSKFQQRVK